MTGALRYPDYTQQPMRNCYEALMCKLLTLHLRSMRTNGEANIIITK